MAKSKKIYLGAALAHAPQSYLQLIDDLRQILCKNFEVLEFYGLHKEGKPKAIYQHDINCVKICDLMVAECSYPSLGLGFEIASTLNLNKQVIAIALNDAKVSRMIKGIDNPLFIFKRYKNNKDIMNIISSVL